MNFFHGNISAETAKRRLLSLQSDHEGGYLVRERRGTYIISFVKNKMKGHVSHITVPRNKNHNLFVSKPNFLNSSVETIVDFIAGHMEAKLIHPVLCTDSDEDDEEEDQDGSKPSEFESKLTVCQVCDKQVSNLLIHLRFHTVTFCQVCEKIINSNTFDGHKAACHPNQKIHQCPHCDFKTPYSHALKGHITTQHPGGGGTYSCEKCDKRFSSFQKLENHVAQDHNNGSFYCKWCQKSYSHRRSLTHHLKSCFKNPDRILKSDSEDEEPLQQLMTKSPCLPPLQPALQEEVKADESDPRVVTLEEIMKLSMEGRWNAESKTYYLF